ncbi:MAG: hypothetical protein WD607_06285 [Candidatus Paceibacterota bacterium]
MKINGLIHGFKRFKRLNLGLKRLLFVVGILLAIILAGMTMGDSDWEGIPLVFFLLFATIYWVLFWICIRIILWISDGFLKSDLE